MKTRRIVCALAILFSIASSAYAQTVAPGMSSPATIFSVDARDLGFDIHTSATSSPMGCSWANTFRIQPSMSNYEAMVSTALTLYTTGKPVTFYVYKCDTDGASIVASVGS
jgi:hypothetical protein